MKKILITWTIIAFLLVGGLTAIGFYSQSKNKGYYALEKKIVSAAKVYYGQYPGKLPIGSTTITSTELTETNFLDNLKVNEEECKGYVLVKNKYGFYNYTGFIKCSNYLTKKYNAQNE